VAKIHIGTSGWSYPRGEGTWRGHFYPAGTRNELEYYTRHFDTVEVNSSFYRPPELTMVKGWIDRTPDGFLFSIKLWQKFTHPTMFTEATGEYATISQEDVELFKNSVYPLANAGKLGALLVQFAHGFRNTNHNQQVVKAIIRTFKEYKLALELRNKDWSDDESIAILLKENNVAWVQIDQPRFKYCIAEELPVTANIGYFRFHGRNAKDWWRGNNETKYRYLYSDDEIKQLAERVAKAKRKVDSVFTYFNNHWQGYAPRNATDLRKALHSAL
jgi:uncharacterized protein YecE (DUF72 family)